MSTRLDRQVLLAELRDRQLLESATLTETSIEGFRKLGGQRRRVRVEIPPRFPIVAPKVFVRDKELERKVPHVFAGGYVCYHEYEGLFLDRRNPVGIVENALQLVDELVTKGGAGANREDFIEELSIYWGGELAASHITLNEKIRWVRCVDTLKFFRHYFDDKAQERRILGSVGQADNRLARALYVPLIKVPVPVEPLPYQAWTAEDVRRVFLHGVDSEQLKEIRRLLDNDRANNKHLLLGVPKPKGGMCLLGVDYVDKSFRHPLAKNRQDGPIRTYRVGRSDREYLLERAGANTTLQKKRVLICGCGSVGGWIAMELARAGVGRLDLVDPDRYSLENGHRHFLGFTPLSYLFQKVYAVKSGVEAYFPHVAIDTYPGFCDELLEIGEVDIGKYDLVISATGDPNVDRFLNEFCRQQKQSPPIIFTWLEPLGVGGHALSTHPCFSGCFECLFAIDHSEDTPQWFNRAAFIAPGEKVTRELAGCGSAFTPFSSLDALRTAELATRLSIETLSGKCDKSTLRSWKGDGVALQELGIKLSPRFNAQAPLELTAEDLAQPGCQVCEPKQVPT